MAHRFIGVSDGRAFSIEDVDVWSQPWTRVPKKMSVAVVDPIYGNKLYCTVYEIQGPSGPVRFATREVSNGVWLFFDPEDGG